MNITIYGTGYVGLVTGACFAQLGHSVVCVDIDQQKIDQLNDGIIPIFEPELDDIVKRNHQLGRLHFTTNAQEGIRHGLMQFISVNTPTQEDGHANTDFIMECVKTIAQEMDSYRIIVNKSTAPVGTVTKIRETISAVLKERQVQINFDVASNPEFLREGAAVRDFLEPDRIIIGCNSVHASQQLDELYGSFNQVQKRVIFMDIESAELTKYAANALLATKISFINEIANLAEKVGADIREVCHGLATDPRIGPHFISPGCGYGGSCFPKDVKALIHMANSVGSGSHLIQAVEEVNHLQKQIIFKKIVEYFGQQLSGKTLAIWGLAFKPNTNDIREAPSRVLMELLWNAGAFLKAYDPAAMQEIAHAYPNQSQLELCKSKEECLSDADALIICTEWAEFCNTDLEIIKTLLKNKVIFDGRNIFSLELASSLGFHYFGIGR